MTDIGIVMFRRLLEEQMGVVEDGGEPMNVFRDPAENECIVLPQERSYYPGEDVTGGPFKDQKAKKAEEEASVK